MGRVGEECMPGVGRRGEELSVVFIGERDLGGGNRALRRPLMTSPGSGPDAVKIETSF